MSIKKWIIGAVTITALSGAIALTNLKSSTREIYENNAQNHLNIAFERLNTSHLERVVYDPDFKEQDNYLRKQITPYSKERDIEKYILEAHKSQNSSNMCVTGVIFYVGDGKKRPAFARKKLFESKSILTQEDLNNIVRHENVHAEEERKGYDFGTERKMGKELTKLFNTNQIRLEIIKGIGEIGAYATQIDAIEKGIDKTSEECLKNAKVNLQEITRIIQKGLINKTLTPLERKYAETKIKKYNHLIQKL